MSRPTQVATRPIDTFRAQVKLALPTVMRMLPQHVTPEMFESRVVTCVANNPKLLECTSDSLLKACAEAAELGLSLNPQLGEAWILPVWNSKLSKLEAQLRPGYIGLMKLARQSGEVRKIEAHVRYENDTWHMQRGINPDLQHVPADGDRGDKLGVYCWWQLRDGEKQFEYMPREDVEKIRARSSAKNKDGEVVGPWVSDEDEMWRKTVVRRSRKYMPQSPEMEKFHNAMSMDNAREFDEPPVAGEYVDVTEPAATTPADAGKVATDKLADKVAPQTSATPALTRIEPPQGFDGIDYFAWAKTAETAVAGMDKPTRAAWRKLHADILKNAPPEVAEGLS